MPNDSKPTPLEVKAEDVPFATDGLSSPAIYADQIRGAMVVNGVAKLNLVEVRANAKTAEIHNIHVATIILPAHEIRSWADFLLRLVSEEAPSGNGE